MAMRIMGVRLLIIVLLGVTAWGCVDGTTNTGGNDDNGGVDFSSILMGAWRAPDSSTITFTETRITGSIGSLRIACNYRATAMMITLSNCDAGSTFAGNNTVTIIYTIIDDMLAMTVLNSVFEYTWQNDGDTGSNDDNAGDDGNTDDGNTDDDNGNSDNTDDGDDDNTDDGDDDNTDDDNTDDDNGNSDNTDDGDDDNTDDTDTDDDNTDDDDDNTDDTDDGNTDNTDDGNTDNTDDDTGNSGGLVGMWSATDSSTLTFTGTRVTGMLGTISVSCNYSATAMSATLSNCDDIPGIPISINGFTAAYTLAGDVLTVTFLDKTREYTRQ